MNVLFMGPPGSGKGTQSKLLCERFGMEHLSTGDILREAIVNKTEVGMRAKSFMDKGEYAPDAVVIALIRDRLSSMSGKGFILDGFPRTVPQAQALDQVLTDLKLPLKGIFFFNVEKDVLVNRLSSRRTCKNCNRIASVDQLSKENCSVTGKQCEFFQRDDDKPEVITKRIQVYQEQTTPVIDYYKNNSNFLKVDGALPADQIFQIILKKLS
jgi:adenylate kinase